MTGKPLSLHELAEQSGKADAITSAIANGANPDEKAGQRQEAPLHVASRNDNVEAANALITSGANTEIRDCDGANALEVAIWKHASVEMVKLLSSYIQIMPKNLHEATSYVCDRAVIKHILEFGVNPNIPNRNGNTALHLYAQRGNDQEVIRDLIKHGADPNARNNFGNTPLHSAKQRNPNTGIFQTLVAAGSDLNLKNMDGETPSQIQFLPPNVRRVQF